MSRKPLTVQEVEASVAHDPSLTETAREGPKGMLGGWTRTANCRVLQVSSYRDTKRSTAMNRRSDEAGSALGDGILPQYLTLPRQAIQIATRFLLRVVREKPTQLS